MALEIEETIEIAAPPEAVWKLLVDCHSWRLWWKACLEAEAADKRPLRDGSRVRLVLQPSWIRMRFRPIVEVATPGRALIWSGRGFGITGRHAFYLEARPAGTRVRQHEVFSGPGVVFFRLLRLDEATRAMFRQNLRGLKQLAERTV